MTTPPQNQTELERAIDCIEHELLGINQDEWARTFIADMRLVLLAAKRSKELEKENETLHKQLDKGFQILFECGYCECGGQIVHHIDEPFFNCDTCNRHGESTTIPLIQRFTIKTQENKQQLPTLRTEYKNALESLKGIKGYVIHMPACRTVKSMSYYANNPMASLCTCDLTERIIAVETILSTPSAIAVMKGDKV